MFVSPLVKATLQATALSTGSNITAQIISAYQKNRPITFDILQFLRFMILTLITTPPNYKWQQFLEYTFPGYAYKDNRNSLPLTERDAKVRQSISPRKSSPARKKSEDNGQDYGARREKGKLNIRNTFLKWLIDCMTVGTVVNSTLFMIIMGALKGHDLSEIWISVQKETLPLILAGYRVWPIVSIISFSFVPVERRIVFLSSIGFLWNIYMSLVAARI